MFVNLPGKIKKNIFGSNIYSLICIQFMIYKDKLYIYKCVIALSLKMYVIYLNILLKNVYKILLAGIDFFCIRAQSAISFSESYFYIKRT